jgi:glutamate--cysteine ligase
MKPTDPINPDTDFASYFIENAKPAGDWAIGPEIEVFGFTRDTLERLSPERVQEVIKGLSNELTIISQKAENGFVIEAEIKISFGGRLTLEPGGQLEISIAPHQSLNKINGVLKRYFASLNNLSEQLGIIFVTTGFDPLRKIDEQQWIPKRRYEIMRPYLASRGRRAWDMMCRTAAIQVNLDYSDLEDLAKKFTLANQLAPIAAAIFANSPFEEGKLSGYKSTRYAAWLETDAQRTGATPCGLDGEFSIGRFLTYVKQVPMFFIRRKDSYVNLAGYDFNQFLATGAQAELPIWQDFTDHLSTIFTEARLKPYLEQRSMDCGHSELIMAAMAFWKGLLYDREALDQALELASKINGEEYAALQFEVARFGLKAKCNDISVEDLAIACVELARQGLQKIAPDEVNYLSILEQYTLGERICPADILIKNFNGRWNGDIRKAIAYLQVWA